MRSRYRAAHCGRMLDYVGAGARLTPDRGLELDARRWAWQEKIDGCYARVTTDRLGAISSVMARSGRRLADADDLLGIIAGPPDAVLHGELEAHTEAGNRIAATRGYRLLHLFDVTRSYGISVEREPYSERYGLLHRAHAAIEQTARGRIAPMQPDRRTFNWRDRTRPVNPGAMVPGGPPRDLRRFPIVHLHRGAGAGAALWSEHVERLGGEGLVAVRLDAPARARGGKKKIKATDTLDCTVVAVEARCARLVYRGRSFIVSMNGKHRATVGQTVEVKADGWYEHGVTPKFARIVRVRADLT